MLYFIYISKNILDNLKWLFCISLGGNKRLDLLVAIRRFLVNNIVFNKTYATRQPPNSSRIAYVAG